MEADWEFEIGGNAPVIEADWPGFVNLHDEPTRVDEIVETRSLPGLSEALLLLNEKSSAVWTSKTDVFAPEQVDADELSSTIDETKFALACYIDILMRSNQAWSSPVIAEQSCRNLCARMREIPLRCCRVDLVIRRAQAADEGELGATVYFTACGRTSLEAGKRLGECLAASVRFIAAVG